MTSEDIRMCAMYQPVNNERECMSAMWYGNQLFPKGHIKWSLNFSFGENLKEPACAFKWEGWVLATLRYFTFHKLVRNSGLETFNGKEVSIQNLSTGSLPRRLSVVSVKVEDNTDVPDLNSSNYSINLPQADPKSTTGKNGSSKYVI